MEATTTTAIQEPYKKLRLFGQTLMVPNPDICDLFRTNQRIPTLHPLVDDTSIPNPHLNIPYEPRNRQALELVPERQNPRMVQHEDPWKIKKRLMKSDVRHLSRLLLGQNDVNNHILTHFTPEQCAQVRYDNGLDVTVRDLDRNNEPYRLRFKYWSSSESYVFLGGWSKDFVKRRGLKQGDEIKLYWDTDYSTFNFSVTIL